MPVYVYRCRDCGSQLEVRQSFSDAPLSVCEACGGRLHKVFQPATVIYKGSGFYSTDYRSKSGGNGRNGDGTVDKTDSAKPAGSAGKDDGAKSATDATKGSGSTITASTSTESKK